MATKGGMLSPSGRSTRRDYIIVNLVLGVGPALVGAALERPAESAFERLPDLIGGVAAIALLIGVVLLVWILAIAMPVRRLHDMNLSGWFYLLIVLIDLVPIIGPIVTFVWLVLVPGTRGRNRFGADPRGAPDGDVARIFDGPPVDAEASAPTPSSSP